MRKLFKKSLAICIAAVLCVTLFAGALSVNADAALTYSTNAIEANPGDQVEIEFTISNFSDVEGARLSLTLPSVIESIDAVSYGETALEEYDDDEGTGFYIVENVRTLKLISLFGNTAFDNFESTSTFTLNITATVADDAEEGVYEYGTPVIELGTESALLEVTGEFGTFEVVEAVIEPQEPVVDESITCVNAGGLGTSGYISFRFTKSQLTQYSSFEFQLTRDIVDGSSYNFTPSTTVVTDTASTSSYLYYYCRGIELYGMTVPVTGVLYCKDAEGKTVAKSSEITTSLKDALVGIYNRPGATEIQKRTITDLIVAGAEVQKFMTANAQSSDLAKMPLPTVDFPLDYASGSLGELATHNVNGSANGITIGTGGGVTIAPYLTFNFAGISVEDAANYNVTLSYYDEIAKKNVSKVVNLASDNANDVQRAGSKYYVYFREMSIPATNAAVTATVTAVGSEDALATYSYCFDAFTSLRLSHAQLGPVVTALGKLGQSFRAFNGL